MSILDTNIKNRTFMLDGVKEQVTGPNTYFETAVELTDSLNDKYKSPSDFYYWTFGSKKEEVLLHYDNPNKLYIAGKIYPQYVPSIYSDNDEIILEEPDSEYLHVNDNSEDIFEDVPLEEYENKEDPIIESQNRETQKSFGITFAISEETEHVNLDIEFGRYEKKIINLDIQKNREWFFRKTIQAHADIYCSDMKNNSTKSITPVLSDLKGNILTDDDFKIELHIYLRKINNIKICTVSVINRNSYKTIRSEVEDIMFQPELTCTLDENLKFRPYPRSFESNITLSDEDKKFEMLYLDKSTYGFGHGCSLEWNEKENDVYKLSSTFVPSYEIENLTPNVQINLNGKLENLVIKHIDLAMASSEKEVTDLLLPMIDAYESWLLDRENEISRLPEYYHDTAHNNLKTVSEAIIRMKRGLELINNNKHVFSAFKLANMSMLMQMVNGKHKRNPTFEKNAIQYDTYLSLFSENNFIDIDNYNFNKDNFSNYSWRAFQIAFLLLSIQGIVDKESKDRCNVDLIWFPTGGGKTEAYLGVAAFSISYRRILNPKDIGMDVLMRYTLRLLTADQFQRASRLICSLEFVRRLFPDKLGHEEISIGLWVGSATSPNNKESADFKLKDMINNKTDERFPINSCPWCGAKFEINSKKFHGFEMLKTKLKTYCPDKNCSFNNNLPINFVDEELYKNPPTFLIGTVDKFVQLTWKPNARTLFGISNSGERKYSPPNIIIQDEFHLISGPLGTLTGIYEILIEELCTDYRNEVPIIPKIIAATATIRDSERQVLDVFGRTESAVFPPSALSMNENFFSSVEMKNGKQTPGRMYAGVYSTTISKAMSQTIVQASLLENAALLPSEQRDPYWTILSFYNSIRDIGVGKNLTQTEITTRMNNFFYKRNLQEKRRNIYDSKILELTGRKSSSEVVEAIDILKKSYNENLKSTKEQALDMCLASNIIEVGIDIDRLSLMTIIGQPKTNAQYIQVSGRVGRKTWERPGLVVTVFSGYNSRDKSHFEHFKEYHQKLYGQVESTSTTPFSQLSIERGLPAILVGYLRQSFDIEKLGNHIEVSEIKKQQKEINKFINNIRDRVKIIDNSELEFLTNEAKKIINKIFLNRYTYWKDEPKYNREGVFYSVSESEEMHSINSIKMINSMRTVDSNSRLFVSQFSEDDEEMEYNFDD